MGPIQTAISQALGSLAGAAIAGKSQHEKETKRQAAEEKADAKAEKKEASSPVSKALRTAQDRKIDSPKQIYFWGQDPEPLATSSELASVLANTSLQNATSSKSRSRNKVRDRKQALMKRKLARRD